MDAAGLWFKAPGKRGQHAADLRRWSRNVAAGSPRWIENITISANRPTKGRLDGEGVGPPSLWATAERVEQLLLE